MELVFPTVYKTVCGLGEGAVMGSTPIRAPSPQVQLRAKEGVK